MLVIFDLDGTLFKAKTVLPALAPDDPEYNAALLRNVRERGELFPSVTDALRELRDLGYPMSVCSASSLDYIEAALEITNIRAYFGTVHSAPARDGKAEIIRTLAAPGDAVVIGDTWRDMDAARSCGFYCVAALYGYGKRELIRADAYVEAAEEIPGVVRQITNACGQAADTI